VSRVDSDLLLLFLLSGVASLDLLLHACMWAYGIKINFTCTMNFFIQSPTLSFTVGSLGTYSSFITRSCRPPLFISPVHLSLDRSSISVSSFSLRVWSCKTFVNATPLVSWLGLGANLRYGKAHFWYKLCATNYTNHGMYTVASTSDLYIYN